MWSGGPVVRLSQTSPIPRSPDGDNNWLYLVSYLRTGHRTLYVMLRCGRAYRNSTVALSSLLVMQKCLCSHLRLTKGLLLVLQSYSRLLGITFYHIRTQDYMHTILRKGKSLFPCHSIPGLVNGHLHWRHWTLHNLNLLPSFDAVIHTISLTYMSFFA